MSHKNDARGLARQVLASLRPDVAAALRDLVSGSQVQKSRPHRATGRPPGLQLAGLAAQLQDRAWLEGAYASKSADAIAAEVGCNPKTVLSWLRRHGIETRRASEASRRFHAAEKAGATDAAIALLRAWGEAHDGRAPTVAEWERTRPRGSVSEKSLRHMFGSWRSACAAAGLESHGPGWHDPEKERQRRDAQAQAILDGIRAWAAEHNGEVPTSSEWDHSRPIGAPATGVVRKLFGTWPDAVKAAGLQPLRPGQKKNLYEATAKGKTPRANRQMVTGKGLNDRLPGTVKHFGNGMRDAA